MNLSCKQIIGATVVLVGFILVFVGLWPYFDGLKTTSEYSKLADASSHNASQASSSSISDTDIDWAKLTSQNSSVAAWVRVENTSIDYPVVAPDNLSYYLKHDFWNKPSYVGCPFIDYRSRADAAHVLIYAHHFTFGGMFSELANKSEQNQFNTLGELVYSTPSHKPMHLVPLCALRQDKSYGTIQKFSFDGQYDLQMWLKDVLADSQAQAPHAEQMIKHTTRVVTLVTCASDLEGQRPRSIVVFVDGL